MYLAAAGAAKPWSGNGSSINPQMLNNVAHVGKRRDHDAPRSAEIAKKTLYTSAKVDIS